MSLHNSYHASPEMNAAVYERHKFAESSSFFHEASSSDDDDDDDDDDKDDDGEQENGDHNETAANGVDSGDGEQRREDEVGEATPTPLGAISCPRKIITQWTAQDSADYVAGLGLRQYCKAVIGECLVPSSTRF